MLVAATTASVVLEKDVNDFNFTIEDALKKIFNYKIFVHLVFYLSGV
jgi:uncharacterized membrane protein (GlpM family)